MKPGEFTDLERAAMMGGPVSVVCATCGLRPATDAGHVALRRRNEHHPMTGSRWNLIPQCNPCNVAKRCLGENLETGPTLQEIGDELDSNWLDYLEGLRPYLKKLQTDIESDIERSFRPHMYRKMALSIRRIYLCIQDHVSFT